MTDSGIEELRDWGIEGFRIEGKRGLSDCGKRVLLNHLSPRGLVGFYMIWIDFWNYFGRYNCMEIGLKTD